MLMEMTCSELSWGDGISIAFTEEPDSSDFHVESAWGSPCGYLQIDYSVSTPGTYEGNVVLESPAMCQPLLVPLQFTITEPDSSIVEATNFEWYDFFSIDALFNNGESCASFSEHHYAFFADSTGYNGCWWGDLDSGVELEISQAPDSSDFSLEYVYAELCFGHVYIDVQHSVSTPGNYEGYFTITPPGSCQGVQVPFQFTITEPDNGAVEATNVEWYDSADHELFSGDGACPLSNGYSYAHFNDTTGYNGCWGDYLGYGVDVELIVAPNSSDFMIDQAYGELCYGSGFVEVHYAVTTPGDYKDISSSVRLKTASMCMCHFNLPFLTPQQTQLMPLILSGVGPLPERLHALPQTAGIGSTLMIRRNTTTAGTEATWIQELNSKSPKHLIPATSAWIKSLLNCAMEVGLSRCITA